MPHDTNSGADRAYLVALDYGQADLAESMAELAELCRTLGAEVVGQIRQKRSRPDPASYLGRGKAGELADAAREAGATMVVINEELSPGQQRNLSDVLKIRLVDRTQLILDIFAQRARTKEGKLQVELARLNYMLPRLAGLWTHLERQGGASGMRGGPGERQSDVDRRQVRQKIRQLEEEIIDVGRHRQHAREARLQVPVPLVALVGYTNVGKSTLFNKLAKSEVYADNLLFATLDPTTRRVRLPGGWDALMTDTVGFVRNLPHQLVAAFRATLEEVRQADLLLHLVDASHPHQDVQIEAVNSVLDEIGMKGRPQILVYTKSDLVRDQFALRDRVSQKRDAVYVSGKTGEGMQDLLNRIQEVLSRNLQSMSLYIPYQRGELLNICYLRGRVLDRRDSESGVHLQVELPEDLAGHIASYQETDPPFWEQPPAQPSLPLSEALAS